MISELHQEAAGPVESVHWFSKPIYPDWNDSKSRLMRPGLVLLGVLAYGCATLTPGGAHVTVFQARLGDPLPQRSMPGGCSLVGTRPPARMTELDLDGQKDPFRKTRNEAADAGANALLAVRRTIMDRRSSECPPSLRITDCAGSLGAWYDVTVETYSCTPDALASVSLPRTLDGNVRGIKIQ
ncbi:MAG: hypothetical protein DMF89_26225 [Acidobacteria bacterium]|nr:MAG: hypothetical protein DMF90_11120 [Acidobacteriota bacterium]PYR45004.1 MAG: hypothetical protein DMF89_26225 [Acidobacteriota bacterium]